MERQSTIHAHNYTYGQFVISIHIFGQGEEAEATQKQRASTCLYGSDLSAVEHSLIFDSSGDHRFHFNAQQDVVFNSTRNYQLRP